MNLQKAAQQALEALKEHGHAYWNRQDEYHKAIVYLHFALCNDRSADAGKTSDHFPDATKMVEPVAYVTGYRDGFCVISPIEPVVFPTGMALYMSPPTSQESRQVEPVSTINEMETVEPVAWLIEAYDIYAKRTLQRLVFDNPKNMQGVKVIAHYTATPQRKPLPLKEVECLIYEHTKINSNVADDRELLGYIVNAARAIERAHGIGCEK